MRAQSNYIVIDVGGTNLRMARFDPVSGRLDAVARHPMVNFYRLPGASVGAVQEAVVQQLLGHIQAMLAEPAWRTEAVCISFAGPIDDAGDVVGAPTVWGGGGAPLPLARRLSDAVGLPVHVLNDVTAAAWRYADAIAEPFCLITVSSGIGNKVLYDGKVLVNRYGYGGEIGHLRVDHSDDAPLCDCGGRGHLGALGSGRGAVETAKRHARADPAGYAASLLHAASGGQIERIDAVQIVAAVKGGDEFAWRCVRHGIGHLARAVAGMYAAIGVRRYVIMGGFAQALAPHYLQCLAQELQQVGMFGIAPEAIPGLLQMAAPDDDHGLIGAGRYLQRLLANAARLGRAA